MTGVRCYDCGKISLYDKSDAKRAIRQWGMNGNSVYACPYGHGYHFGHLPDAVRRGLAGREDIYRRTDRVEDSDYFSPRYREPEFSDEDEEPGM